MSALSSYARKIVLIRYNNVENVNYVVGFDTDLNFISDVSIDSYIRITEGYSFPEQNTDNEPQVWAMPGEKYDPNKNL